ncbi:MAG: response regulator transcription factor [Candidatus Delongbacteria bacterium]|jgi:two-component system alkaline phosphatase synthesis response regulator PhoP|nr:response regulator transcription factor [Candidatus Delongbacteria bacterium]
MFEPEKYTILLVDDEPDILEFLSYNLKSEGYRVITSDNGLDAIQQAQIKIPDLIILDIMMPEMDGIETCEKLRNIAGLEHVLIMFLTARGEDYSQVAGFDAGGDDYVNKPIKPKIIKKRIKAILKRVKKEVKSLKEHGILEFDNLIIDPKRFLVIRNTKEIMLPRKEFKLLHLLASKPSRVFTREEIYNHIWGDDIIVGDRTIDVHIRRLREKIGNNLIKTTKGVGYKFEP